MPADVRTPRRATRLRLYTPFVLLGLLAVCWSVAWFVVRARTVAGMDDWVAAEATAGRRWTCSDRNAGGYPFRVEVSCRDLSFASADATASVGPVLAVAQIYRLGHIIVEAQGPLRVVTGAASAEAGWRLLQASVVFASGSFQRLALVADDVRLQASERSAGSYTASAKRFEAHARPDPADATVADLSFTTAAATLPGLDALIGGTEPADIDLVLRVGRAFALASRPAVSELERWRIGGGEVEVARARLAKGPRRFEAQGRLGLDDSHRPRGEITGQVAGIEGLLGQFVGDKAGLAGNLLGALLGGGRQAELRQPSDPNAPRMKAIPTLRLENGRLAVGPLQLPNLRIPPLY